jgi:hypothetical protein
VTDVEKLLLEQMAELRREGSARGAEFRRELGELKDEVSDLRVEVASISPPKRALARDGGMAVGGGALAALLTAVVQAFVK